MNAIQIKEIILNNPEYIEHILDYIRCYRIREYPYEYRAGYDEDSNPTGISIRKNNLYFIYRSNSKEIKGDIFTLIQEKQKCTFPEAVKLVCKILKIDGTYQREERQLPFSGYYKKVKMYSSDMFYDIPTYPEDVLKDFWDIPNTRFLKDGISLYTQKTFGIMYDALSERISVPWRNVNGEIVGIMGRYNGDDFEQQGIAKWYPIIPFSKTQVLYGLYENYKKIQEKRRIFIGESEKFCQQLHSMNILTGVAVGCHSVSPVQARYVKGCFPEEVIICFDEGVEEKFIQEECKKLQYNNGFIDCKVGYVFDSENKYIPFGSKSAPSDYGKEKFVNIITNCIKWI